jgi:hypothetical protein
MSYGDFLGAVWPGGRAARTGHAMKTHYRWSVLRRSFRLPVVGVAVIALCAGVAGCCDFFDTWFPPAPTVDPNTGQVGVRTDDPLSGQIADDANLPYDRAAVLAVINSFIEPDLSGYRFALLFVFQSQLDRDEAFDVFVNGQRLERRKVQAGRQEIVAITNQNVLDTEAITGVHSETRFGKPVPFIVTFANFVAADDHIAIDQSFILAPLNAFRTDLIPITKDQPSLQLGPVYVCPSVIAIVLEKTRMRVILLDREFAVPDYTAQPQEPGDPPRELFPFAADIIWAPEQVTLFNQLGVSYLLQAR